MKQSNPATVTAPASSHGFVEFWLPKVTWGVAVIMVAVMAFILVRRASGGFNSVEALEESAAGISNAKAPANLPLFAPSISTSSIHRSANPHTTVPDRPREEAIEYTVEAGDSIFSIAKEHDIEPETILWANYDTLTDNPDMISPGIKLRIPAVDGVYYQWKKGDTLEQVAASFQAKVQDILSWPANHLDMADPVIEPDQYVMVPGGQREFRQWLMPTIPRGAAGVAVNMPGACNTSKSTAVGTGAFVWPSANHSVSGNDYWSGHLAIDIAAGDGMEVWAADGGVVVFAGGVTNGYGRVIMIDHGNGYQTLYAHLSVVGVSCGQTVVRGQRIGLSGSTGNSTGPHLHFEVRYLGGFIDPWYVLP